METLLRGNTLEASTRALWVGVQALGMPRTLLTTEALNVGMWLSLPLPD